MTGTLLPSTDCYPLSRNARRRRRALALALTVLATVGVSLTTAPAASADVSVTVDFTNIGIYPRSAPLMGSEHVGAAIADGTAVTVVCELESEPVSNGYETIAIWDRLSDGTWLPNAFLATGTSDWTPGVPHCDEYDGGVDTSADDTSAIDEAPTDPCLAAWPGGTTNSVEVFGGTQTNYDREMSGYLVCEGFGAEYDVEYSAGMKCAIVAATATASGIPGAGQATSQACDAASVVESWSEGDWLGAAHRKPQ